MPAKPKSAVNEPEFAHRYPRETSTGVVALLCEGDVNGYEASFLETWAAATLPNTRVAHVWACGTGHSLFGTADAIGRTVRFVVIEDRDFRDLAAALADCQNLKKDRANRGLAILDWRCWRRNEVENYFLDDDILQPVMADAFGCSTADVNDAVDLAVKLLVPFQALQAAIQMTRARWEATDPQCLIGPSRPQWTTRGLAPVDPATIESDLKARLIKWRATLCDNGGLREPWRGDALIDTFKELTTRWATHSSSSAEWREVWAGKEILKYVRQQLCAGRSGWWSCDRVDPRPLHWAAMPNNPSRDAHDRFIEKTLLPKLVNRLVDAVTLSPNEPRWAEFKDLAQVLMT
jgi:hypothetical protein